MSRFRARKRRPTSVLIGAVSIVLCLALAAAILDRAGPKRVAVHGTQHDHEDRVGLLDRTPTTTEALDKRLLKDLDSATSVAEKLALLDAYRDHDLARSDSTALRRAALSEKEGLIRVRAYELATDLAVKEGRSSIVAVLKQGVANPHSDVRKASLRACRVHPNFELLRQLIEIVEDGGPDRHLAVQALAFLDDPEAHRQILLVARSADNPRELRLQAVALLSRTSLREAVEYLQELVRGDDDALRMYAMEALEIWQARNASR